jgi:alpha-2-macroglobulin
VGEAALAADGKFAVRFTPLADEAESRDVSYRYRVSAAVRDEGGETREAEKSYRLGFVAVEATVERDAGFGFAGKPATLRVVRTDLNGAPRSGSGRYRLLRLLEPRAPRLPAEESVPNATSGEPGFETPGDRERPRWERGTSAEQVLFGWEDGEELHRGEVVHGADGRGELSLLGLEPGAYRLRYETADEFGELAKAQSEWVVTGARGETPVQLAALLALEQRTVRVGETARLVVHSGFADQPLLLETYQSGSLRERRWIRSGRDASLIEIPIGEEHRGGLAIRLSLLRDHQVVVLERAIQVPWDNKELALEFSTFRDRVRPGTRETFRVTVRGADRERAPVAAAELLAYMYDRSLDAFAPHDPQNPRLLFPNRALLAPIQWSVGARSASHVSDRDFVVLPEPPVLEPDTLLFIYGMFSGTGFGVEGGVPGGVVGGTVGGVMRTMQAMEVIPEAPPPSPAPTPAKPQLKSLEPGVQAATAEVATAPALRSNFSETAFWQPHLLTGADGSAAIEFSVPDSVTSWSVWVHALTRDLRSGSLERETQSVKELLVRPYLPRFLREGDRAELLVVVNNAGEQPLQGAVRLEILDSGDDSSQLQAFGLDAERATRSFSVEPGGGTSVVFPLQAPRRVGAVAFKVTGLAGDWSDGELRPLPILPGRLHLAQSRFAALRGNETRTLTFTDLQGVDDPTRVSEQLVVTLDAQLFYGVLDALPYLVQYPYECTEQTLNRFLSTGIVSSLFARYPAVAKMAAELSKRETQFEAWAADDPNRKMALEETPWLEIASGKQARAPGLELIRVLDPQIAAAQRSSALARLEEAQLPSGAFPWWPGGPPSDYMTAYLLGGFAKAAEFEVEIPREMVESGWSYIGQRYREEWQREIAKKDGCCLELLTLLNYVASAYPDPGWMGEAFPEAERRKILDWSFAHWRQFSPHLKGLLALTLHRMGRGKDAFLVFDSVMDTAKTTRDLGTFWMPEDRAWLWYNDTIEGHAFALRALLELRPQDPRAAGLVQWLFLNKKLGHWTSTRSTSEVLYSLAVYLEQAGQLGQREAATVAVANRTTSFVWEPDRYTGKRNQIVVPGAVVDAEHAATVTVKQESPGLMFASATWHFATDLLPKEASGDLFHVERRYYRRLRGGAEVRLEPLAPGTALAVGDEVEVQLSLSSRVQAEYVHLRDPRAAGFEPGVVVSGYRYDLGIGWYEETRDSGANFFFEWLPAGEYTFKYRVRANVAGEFRVGPAQVQSMYAPEFVAYSAGNVVVVQGGE